MPDMTLTSLAAAVVPRTSKITKNNLHVFKLSQSSEIALESYTDERLTFLKAKGLGT